MSYPTRRPAPLAETTNKRLFSYALAAGAGMFAAAQPADAGVIYTNPADVTITNSALTLDLDGDGIPDVNFATLQINFTDHGYQKLMVNAPQGGVKGAVGAGTHHWRYANKAIPSYFVGPNKNFVQGYAKMARGYRHRASVGAPWYGAVSGWWGNVTDGFLGVQFTHQANPVYGWVRMDVSVDPIAQNITYTVKDWAYEDNGGPVHVGAIPEPGTLGLLALGSVALAAWRRRKRGQA